MMWYLPAVQRSENKSESRSGESVALNRGDLFEQLLTHFGDPVASCKLERLRAVCSNQPPSMGSGWSLKVCLCEKGPTWADGGGKRWEDRLSWVGWGFRRNALCWSLQAGCVEEITFADSTFLSRHLLTRCTSFDNVLFFFCIGPTTTTSSLQASSSLSAISRTNWSWQLLSKVRLLFNDPRSFFIFVCFSKTTKTIWCQHMPVSQRSHLEHADKCQTVPFCPHNFWRETTPVANGC